MMPRTNVRNSQFPGLLFLLLALSAPLLHAQSGGLTEQTIEQGKVPVADDAFAYMPPYGKPVGGKPAIQDANTKRFSDRTNITRAWVGEHRIVPAASGEMAYEYGILEMGYESKSEGHQTFKAVMLIVYGAHGGLCQQVALTMQPLDEPQPHYGRFVGLTGSNPSRQQCLQLAINRLSNHVGPSRRTP
jgi:hypothetical protein